MCGGSQLLGQGAVGVAIRGSADFSSKGDKRASVSAPPIASKSRRRITLREPLVWVLPVRHSLGATLMKYGRFADAEQVYCDDLTRLPENGWSLFGLARSLKMQQKNPDEVA